MRHTVRFAALLAVCLASAACGVTDDVSVDDPSSGDVPPAGVDRSVPNDRALDPDGGTSGIDGGASGTDGTSSGTDGTSSGADGTSSGADGTSGGPERCNQVDDDGDGMVDEGCACASGMTQPCFPGRAGARMVGTCRDGMQRCEGEGEFGAWGECTGAVTPATDVCADRSDQDCNGTPDDGADCCRAGASTACYSGPMGTLGRGICRGGTRMCAADGTPGQCVGEVLPRPEVCNGVDDDCDGTVDGDCRACIMNGGASTPWQMHLGEGPRCWGRTFSAHGDPGEYAFSRIPPQMDAGWRPHTPPSISFDDPSTLCGVCECRAGGDFTYFQTSFYVAPSVTVSSLRVNIADVDDGVSVAVFNTRYPAGIVDPGAYAYLGGGSTSDLARYVVAGHNRVVLTHVDDCCMVRRIANATVSLNGTALVPCR